MIAIPGYETQAQIFQSSNSRIYRAKRSADGVPVILKMLAQSYPSPRRLASFKREFEITRGLELPGVVDAYELEEHDHHQVMVLEDFGGEPLTSIMTDGAVPVARALELAIDVVEILGEIHERHTMHKDINPSNIVVNADAGTLKLIDFGISTVLSRETPALRSPNVIEGTLAYISPEQTGRMNRVIDYRADFYSLGVTLYQMLTGQLPFSSKDPMELVHSHIARRPATPHERNPQLPPVLSAIVMKMMAKNAEDRYQSARGLRADLEQCQKSLAAGEDPQFEIGQHDVSDRFQLPQKLYGRNPEVARLLEAFGRVAEGAAEMMLVSGYAGIGKSALVQEIYRPITERRGYFIAGKFDQFQRNIPYASLVQAFRSLVRQLLTESEEQIGAWKERLLEALGDNAQVLIDVIPEIELIVGPQPAAVELAPTEAQNRLGRVFQSFIRVFARPEHPLVLFLDDLQWADTPSLNMIHLLMTGADRGHQLVIGAYRDNEVGTGHPLTLSLEEIDKDGGVIDRIRLQPLSPRSVQQLVADTVHSTVEHAGPLAELVRAKTNGNPFFINEFLKSLYGDELLSFSSKSGSWVWDVDRIGASDMTDNVVELMASKVKRLEAKTQRILELAACIGASFDLATLATVHEQSARQTASDLWEAIAEGLVVPLSDGYKLMELDVQGLAESMEVEYKFAHDRIQQAAYSLITDEARPKLHHRIGRLLVHDTSAEDLEHRLFDVVNQLNQGAADIAEQSERDELADLDLKAGRRAKTAAAYAPALAYLQAGIECLGEAGWTDRHETAVQLHVEATEAAYLCNEYEEMDRLAAIVLERAKELLPKAEVYEVMLQAFIARNQSKEAVETGLKVLELLGVKIPFAPAPEDIGAAMGETAEALASTSVDALLELPAMTDPYKHIEMRLNNRILPPSYRVAPNLFPLILSKTITLLIGHGNNPQSPFSYALYGLLQCAMGEIDAGYDFGQLALKLLDRLSSEHIRARTEYIAIAFVGHWKDPAHDGIEPLAGAYRQGIDMGDFEFAGFCGLMVCCMSYFTGRRLDELRRDADLYVDGITELEQQTPLTYTKIHRQAFINLTEEVEDPCRLSGESYDAEAMASVHQEANDLISLGYVAVNQLILCYLFGDRERAMENADLVEQYLPLLAAMPHVPVAYFYVALARLSVVETLEGDERAALMEKIDAGRQQIEKFAGHAPKNHQHKHWLLEAEYARVSGDESKAMDAYWKAIELAHDNRYLNEEALAHEVCGRFWLGKKRPEIAQIYLQRARAQYQAWGATTKVAHMEEHYGDQLRSIGSAAGSTIRNTLTSTTTSTTATSMLDMGTVMKAAQTISGEIVLSKLLEKMMAIVIENAGAQRGVLMLDSGQGLSIEAEDSVDTSGLAVLVGKPLSEATDLAHGVVNYVARAHSHVVLSEAHAEGEFVSDPYIAEQKVRSVLCVPVSHRGTLVGVLYLENRGVAGAFTSDRVEMMTLLCAQAAISLENAMLYRTMEQKVDERTRELREKTEELQQALTQLEQMQEQIIVQEKMASLGGLTAGIAHEIRNPLNFVTNFADVSTDLLDELREDIDELEAKPEGEAGERIGENLGAIDQNLRKINEHGRRASQIIGSMLSHARTSSGETESISLNAVLDELVNLVTYSVRSQQPAFQIDIERDLAEGIANIDAVAQEISRVLLNVLNNAFYAVRERQQKDGNGYRPALRLSTLDHGDRVEIRIRDNGTGMSEEVLEKAFNPFFTTKPTGEGVGLGLSLSYDIIVLQHRGSFTIDSVEGEFTEVMLTLPR
ncbi:MAG: AAA family ATPase [Myxococcota bacterium]